MNPFLLPMFYSTIAFSVIAFVAFWQDKQNAAAGQRRIPERTLLIFAAFGGWPGAKVAQQKFRHKTHKQPFGALLNVVSGLHVCLVLCLLLWG